MENIEELIEKKDFKGAETIIREALKDAPDDINLLKNLGLCLVNLNKNQEALEIFLKVIKNDETDATSMFYVASLYEKCFNSKKAIECYKKVIELRENYIDAYKNVTVILVKEKQIEEADKYISKIYNTTKENNEDYLIPYLYANVQILLKNNDFAKVLLNEALQLNPNHIQALNTMGCLCLSNNEINKAFDFYQRSLDIDDTNAVTLFNMATWYVVKNDFENARKYFESAYNQAPTVHHLTQLAFVQIKLKDFASAEKSYQTLCTKEPSSLTFRYNLATCLFEQKKYSQAVSILLPIVQQNPKSAKIAHRLAICFERLGQIKNAAIIYEKIMKLGNVPPEVYLDFANLLVLDNDNKRAENILNKLIKIKPDFALAHKDLGVIYLLERLFDEAKEELDKAIELEPENGIILFEYANYFQATADFATAEKYYEKALKAIPDVESIYLMYGLNQMKQQKNDKAKMYLQKVLTYNTQSHPALYNLAQISYCEQKYETAKEYITDAYLIKADIETSNLLALTYMELNDFHNAKVVLNRLNNEIPNNITILTTLAKAEMLDNKPDMAKNYLEHVLTIFPEAAEAKELMESLTNI